jgi:hypothetical protein
MFVYTGASLTLKGNPVVVIGVRRHGVGRDNGPVYTSCGAEK